MGFRDETEALRAQIEILERDLADAERRAEELEEARRELIVLRARVADLERELGRAPPRPSRVRAWILPGLAAVAAIAAGAAYMAYQSSDALDLRAAPMEGARDLAAIVAAPPTRGTAEGRYAADELGAGCTGFLPGAPLLVLRVAEATPARVWTDSTDDLVLAIQGPDGRVRCDDDSGQRFNPRLAFTLTPGEHRVWVGTFEEGSRASFALHVESGEAPDDSGLHPEAPPTVAALTPELPIWGHTASGDTVGEIPAARARAGCAGHVPLGPHVRLTLEEPRVVQLDATSADDLVLLLRRPDGRFLCDDDGGGGLAPRIRAGLAPGTYEVWVGTFEVAANAEFELTIAASRHAEAAEEPPRLGRWDLTEEPLLSFNGTVEPTAPVPTRQPGCLDLWASGLPDLELDLGQPRAVTLVLNGPPALRALIQRPDGTWICAAEGGLPPTHFGAGTHRVWLGLPGDARPAHFRLVAQAQPE